MARRDAERAQATAIKRLGLASWLQQHNPSVKGRCIKSDSETCTALMREAAPMRVHALLPSGNRFTV